VPDVVGQSQAGAEAALTNAGLVTGTVTHRVSSTQSPNTVISQSPAGGSSVQSGDKVELVIAEASNEVAVPDVVGKSVALASAQLGEVGLKPKAVSTNTAEPSQVGIVLQQSPTAGAHAKKGATITIGVGVLGTPTTTNPTTTTTPTTTPTTSTPPAAAG
jgi:serine/threonine-protein kinase